MPYKKTVTPEVTQPVVEPVVEPTPDVVASTPAPVEVEPAKKKEAPAKFVEVTLPDGSKAQIPVKGLKITQAAPERVAGMAKIVSADKRSLDVSINNQAFVGHEILVPYELEGEARRLLIDGGYFIK